MDAKQLRDVLKAARDKGQIGLLIWANWATWDDLAYEIKPGNNDYELAMSQISKNKDKVVYCENNGFPLVAFIAIPVRKLSSNVFFFNRILKMCNKNNYQGPFTLLPSNVTAESE